MREKKISEKEYTKKEECEKKKVLENKKMCKESYRYIKILEKKNDKNRKMKMFSFTYYIKINYSHTARKNGFNGSLFLHCLGLKPPLSHLPRVAISPAKPSLGNVFF